MGGSTNIHTVIAAHAVGQPQRLVVRFDDDETLEIWDPVGVSVSAIEFRIDHAARVRWEWFYYSRPKTQENRYFIEHAHDGERITVTTNADWAARRFTPSSERPAVGLIGEF